MGDSETEPRVIANTDTETMDFVECFDDDNDAAAARRRHTDNTETVEAAPAPPKPIIPTPLEVEPPDPTKAHQVQITSDWKVVYDDERLRNEAVFIASKMRHVATVMLAAGRIAKIDPSYSPGGASVRLYLIHGSQGRIRFVFGRPRSEGWPHHRRTFSIYLCPLSFWLTPPRGVLSTSI